MRKLIWLVSALIVLALDACGGGTQNIMSSQTASAVLQTIRVLDADGNKMSAGALSAGTATGDTETAIALTVNDPAVAGCELTYNPATEHVSRVVRGNYFTEDDLFLAVIDVSGLVAIGGYQRGEVARGTLLATVYFAEGGTQNTRSASSLPNSTYCVPAEFDYTSDETSATFSWIHNNVGDYNQNGEVNISDLAVVGINWGVHASGTSLLDYNVADGNLDGQVSIADLTPLGANYFTCLSGYALECSSEETGTFSTVSEYLLSDGALDGRLTFSKQVTSITDGWWYRISAYNSEDTSQKVPCSPLQVHLIPEGSKPTAVASADSLSGAAPLTVNFTADGSSDSDGTIASYEWDLDGDGTFETDATAAGGAAQYIYTSDGSYTAQLRVTDDDGYSDQDSLIIQVGGSPGEVPVVYAYALPAQGWAPLTVNVSGFKSADPDGTIATYEWDFDGDGTFETSVTGDWGYASHTYEAGSYTATLRVTDDSGNSSTSSVEIEARDPADSSVDYWNIFDQSQVKRVEISVSQENWDLMWADVEAETEVEADAVVFPGTELETALTSVGFRMKGHSSLNTKSDKKPWKIDTNQYLDDQEFENLKMLIFNNGFADPSLTREILAYQMMEAAGVAASNTCYVEVWISVEGADLEFWGLYTMVEEVDKKFLDNRFGNKSGNLYKCQSGSDLKYYGADITAYPVQDDGEVCYQKETNEDEADYSDVINLCNIIDNQTYSTPEEFATALEGVMNVDSFLRYLAVTLSHSNLDIFMYMNQNFYLYNNPDTGKFEWIPWDLNMSWGQFGAKTNNETCPLYEMGGTGGLSSPSSSFFTQVMSVPAYRQTYAAYVDLLRRSFFTEANIATKAEALHDLAVDSVSQGDKMFYGTNAEYTFEAFDQNWNTDWSGSSGGPGGPGGPGAAFAFGVTSFTATRYSYIDNHLFTDL